MSLSPRSAAAEWRSHWTLVLAALVGFSFMSFMTTVAGVFMAPLQHEFGWNRTQLSMGIALAGLSGIFLSPFLGVLIDRWGTRRIALPGIVLTGLAIAAFSLASGSMIQWLVLWVVWGVLQILVQSTIWSAAVAKAFRSGRGLALAVTISGTAVAQIVAPPLANFLIDASGWRMAYVWLGLGWGAVTFVLAAAFLIDVRQVPGDAGPALAEPGLTLRQAGRDSALWRIGLSSFLVLTISVAIAVHQVPILIETGASPGMAASLASLLGAAAIVGKLVTGILIDRFHARWVGSITLASTAIAYPMMMAGEGSIGLVVVGIMISGYTGGMKLQLCTYLTARYGGLRHFGAIFGTMASTFAMAGSLGPLMAGTIHDHFGSYTPLLWIGVIVSLISGALVLSLGRYPEWTVNPESPLADGIIAPIASKTTSLSRFRRRFGHDVSETR